MSDTGLKDLLINTELVLLEREDAALEAAE